MNAINDNPHVSEITHEIDMWVSKRVISFLANGMLLCLRNSRFYYLRNFIPLIAVCQTEIALKHGDVTGAHWLQQMQIIGLRERGGSQRYCARTADKLYVSLDLICGIRPLFSKERTAAILLVALCRWTRRAPEQLGREGLQDVTSNSIFGYFFSFLRSQCTSAYIYFEFKC